MTLTEENRKQVPAPGSQWRHRPSGRYYTVITMVNMVSDREDYPPHCRLQGRAGDSVVPPVFTLARQHGGHAMSLLRGKVDLCTQLPHRLLLVLTTTDANYNRMYMTYCANIPVWEQTTHVMRIVEDSPEQLAGWVDGAPIFVVDNYEALPDAHKQVLLMYRTFGAMVVI